MMVPVRTRVELYSEVARRSEFRLSEDVFKDVDRLMNAILSLGTFEVEFPVETLYQDLLDYVIALHDILCECEIHGTKVSFPMVRVVWIMESLGAEPLNLRRRL